MYLDPTASRALVFRQRVEPRVEHCEVPVVDVEVQMMLQVPRPRNHTRLSTLALSLSHGVMAADKRNDRREHEQHRTQPCRIMAAGAPSAAHITKRLSKGWA